MADGIAITDGVSGVQFPLDPKGRRSTTGYGKEVWASAAEAADSGLDQAAGAQLAASIRAERDWRHKYAEHVLGVTRLCARSAEAGMRVARAGLEKLHATMEFISPVGAAAGGIGGGGSGDDRPAMSLRDAIAATATALPQFRTACVRGEGQSAGLRAPSAKGGDMLTGDALAQFAESVADASAAEPSVAAAVRAVATTDGGDFGGALSSSVFVLLGANSEMGPLATLLELGATVVAVARPNEARWARLISRARASAGTLLLPVEANDMARDDGTDDEGLAAAAGADVILDAPALCRWLTDDAASGGALAACANLRPVLSSLVYLDGEAHVRASLAMDAICEHVCARRRDAALAYIASPALAYPISREAWDEARTRMAERSWADSWWHGPLSTLTGEGVTSPFSPNALSPVPRDDLQEQMYITDGISILQGPNYALAKTLQLWRAVVARSEGHVVSANMAPPCRTVSVVHNPSVARALRGMECFPPLRVFDAETVAPFMTALMLFDLGADGAEAVSGCRSTAQPSVELSHPFELFIHGAFHGGSQRCAFTTESVGKAAYLLGFLV